MRFILCAIICAGTYTMSVSSEKSPSSYVATEQEKAIKNTKGEQAYTAELKKAGIVPEVINEEEMGPELIGLVVKYPNCSTFLGNELTPLDTKVEPIVDWVAEEDAYYTLLNTDPDVPSRADPIFGEVEHWLVVNIPSNKVHEGDLMTEYIGPGPPKGTGLHRYIFLLFKQPNGKINISEPYKDKNEIQLRVRFNTRDFVKKYNLGNAIAVNYFEAKWDESVGVKKLDIH